MKKFTALTCLAAAALLISSQTQAGTLIPAGSGAISYNPSALWTTQGITVQQVQPDLLKLFGDATITQPASTSMTATLQLAGTFTAEATDMLSAAYNFSITLNSAAAVNYTLNGFAQPSGFPFEVRVAGPFGGTVNQGTSNYSGSFSSAGPLGFTGTGTFRFTLEFTFTAPQAGDTLTLSIPNDSIDIQLAPTAIPEPSTYALVGVGLVGLAVWSRRRASA